ncbi:imidazole glycerol phosphate synthase subunit HisH [Spirochaetia bacterium]|nr:imidazole glycerol phosphate synthase subunit HisH [Spirochaetia bacterium]
MIGVLNYGAGNLGSVMNALKRLGAEARFIRGPEEISASLQAHASLQSGAPFDRLLFPGDGHFGTTMALLEKQGYTEALHEWIAAGRPFLGICIGLQVLFDTSEEAPGENGSVVKGLGIIHGSVKRFPGRKVPQIGWNQTEAKPHSKLFKNIKPGGFFYYIHSYYVDPEDKGCVAAETDYYLRYCCAVEQDNLAALQFHPEKSGGLGLALLENWLL